MSETVLTVHPNLLHPITGLPLHAIGHRRNGEPIWPVIGGSSPQPTPEEEAEAARLKAEQDAAAAGAGDEAELGEKGLKALNAEKERRRTALEGKRTAEAALAAAQAELATLKAGQTGEGDDEAKRKAAIDAAVKTATDEATRNANRRILRADVLAAATGKLRNPKDALAFGDLDSIELRADGTADPSDIDDLITEVLRERSYLGVDGNGRTPSAAEVDAGPRGDGAGNGKPRQVTEAELKTMTPEQIVKAQTEGRLADLLGG